MEDLTKETVNLNVCSIAHLVLSGRSAVWRGGCGQEDPVYARQNLRNLRFLTTPITQFWDVTP